MFFLLVLAGLLGCADQPGEPANIEVAAASEDAAISVEAQPEAVVIAIRDPSGIGQAEFTHTGGEFPERVFFQLYLKGLEQVQLAYGETLVEASLASRPGYPVTQNLAPSGEALQEGSPYWLAIAIVPQDGAEPSIPLQSGYLQVEPPADFYQKQPEHWSLSWVDFYR